MATPQEIQEEIQAKDQAEKAKLMQSFDRGADLSWSQILGSPVFVSSRAVGIYPVRIVTGIGLLSGAMFLLSMCNGMITGRGAQVNDIGDLVQTDTWGATAGALINGAVRGANQQVIDPINRSFRTEQPATFQIAPPVGSDPTLIAPPPMGPLQTPAAR